MKKQLNFHDQKEFKCDQNLQFLSSSFSTLILLFSKIFSIVIFQTAAAFKRYEILTIKALLNIQNVIMVQKISC